MFSWIKNNLGKVGYALAAAGALCTSLGVTAPVGIALAGLGTIVAHLAQSPVDVTNKNASTKSQQP